MKRSRIDLPAGAYVWIGLVFVWLLVFAPHFFNSGFISDDWSVVRSALSIPRFWNLYASWFPLFSNRPLAPLVLSLVAKLCGGDPRGYIFANVAMWLTGLILIATVLKRFFSYRFVLVFLALASFPSIASTVVFSIGMQLVGVASILFWALSLYFLDRHLDGKGRLFLVMSYLLVLLSLLTYEITLPLLAINVFYPSLFDATWRSGTLKKDLAKYLLPTILLLAAILVFQKAIMPAFMTVYSRFSPGSLGNCLGIFLSWCWALLVDFPLLMLDALHSIFVLRADDINLKCVSVAVAGVFAFLLFGARLSGSAASSLDAAPHRRRQHLLLWIVILALFSASFLFILSGSTAQIGGYGNRGMTSTWIALALVVAMVADLYWDSTVGVLVLLLVFLNVCSFTVQRESYGLSWALQREIAASAVAKLNDAKVPLKTATLLGHVPWHVPSNHNGEEVFQNSWDLSAALWFADRKVNLSAMPLNQINVKQLKIASDGLSLNYWKSDFSNLWFYEYNARFGNARLVKLSNAAEAKSVAGQVAVATFNSWRPQVSVRSRELFGNPTITVTGEFALIYAALFSALLRRRREPGPDVAVSQSCRVCGGILFSTWKESDVCPEHFSPDDFKVTDSNYGTTYRIERCAGCGFVQSNCNDVLNFYQQMEDPEYESGRVARTRQFRDMIGQLSRYVRGGRLLDVGAGSGMLVEEALARGFRAEGIEPSGWMARQAETRGLRVMAGVLPDERLAGPYDAITLIDVIEHVSDPAGLLNEIHKLLAPGGCLLLTTPDVDSFAARVMGKRWWHFRLAHISYFTPRTVELLLRRSGYEIVRMSRPNWYFELSYLVARLLTLLPDVPLRVPERFSRVVVPLNLYDSVLLLCRKKP